MFPRLRTRRAVFWYLAPDRIVAAVVARSEREPVLEACAASYSPPVAGACFAPGVVEVAWVLGCEKHAHVAALAASFCRVETREADTEDAGEPGDSTPAPDRGGKSDERCSVVTGVDGMRVWAPNGVVSQAAALFRRARLDLAALDCEPCALASLADVLGAKDHGDARRHHLAAVAVLPESESAAEALGEDLAVPVGLAVAWFGARRAL